MNHHINEISFHYIDIEIILFVRNSIRKHIYWFSSIHFTFQYFRWNQYYQFFKKFRSNFHSLDRIRIIYLFRELFRILIRFLANRSFSQNSMIISISNQKVIQHFNRIFKSIFLSLFNIVSHISIRTIRFARKFSRITFVDSTNQSDFFNIDDEINNTSNSNFKSILQISHIFVQYFDKNSVLKSLVFFENIARSYLFH